MSAVTLDGVPICYNWFTTIGSLAAVVVFMIAGIKVAGNDIFARPDRHDILQEILGNTYMSDKEALWAVTRVTWFHKLHFLFMGSFLAATGAVVMHYTGMMAQSGPFHREWDNRYIAGSAAQGIGICFAGFWIIFRLRWKMKQLWLRYISAAVISVAVCGLHFVGMLGVHYYAEPDLLGTCQSTMVKNDVSPNTWTIDQTMIVIIGILVPSMALYFQNIVNQELIVAYEVTSRSNAIVSSLFPANFRDRLFEDDKSKLRNFLTTEGSDSDVIPGDEENEVKISASKPIADLFTDTTIMFADIAGFTAWSSVREPSQVFMLLETVYKAFDDIVDKHGAFKVETVGGKCYYQV